MLQFILKKIFSTFKQLKSTILVISSSVFFAAAVSMALLSIADNFNSILVSNSRADFGGDLSITVSDLEEEELILEEIKSLEAEGLITSYSKITEGSYGNLLFNNKEEYAVYYGLWNNSWPLVGEVKLAGNEQNPLRLLKENNDILISKELSEKMGFQINDDIDYVTYDYMTTERLHVVGLIDTMPSFLNSAVLMKGESVNDLIDYPYTKYYLLGDQDSISDRLYEDFNNPEIYIKTLDDFVNEQQNTVDQISTFIKSISILGLFVGSIGIATSMNVVIARRKKEIGILKTIGYTKSKIFFMFILELALISLWGGLIGIIAGFFFSNYLKDLFSTIGMSFSFDMAFNWKVAGISLISSIISAVLFGSLSVLNYVKAKPTVIMKDLLIEKEKKDKLINILWFCLIGLLFIGLSILITNSIVWGVGAVVVVFVGFFLMSFLFQLLLGLVLKIKIKTGNVFELSWTTLKSNYKQYSLAAMAIFIGLTVLILLFTIISNVNTTVENNIVDLDKQVNVITYRMNKNDSLITDLLDSDTNVQEYDKKYRTKTEDQYLILEGRDLRAYDWDINLVEGEFLNGDFVLLPIAYGEMFGYGVGDIYTLLINDKKIDLEISGFFESDFEYQQSSLEMFTSAMIVSIDTFEKYTTNYQEVILINADGNNIQSVISDIKQVDDVIISDLDSLNNLLNSYILMIRKLFISTAGLALLAGIILIVNATSLEVVNRKRVFGIYKSIGFTSNQVRNMFLLEYFIILMIVSIFAILLSYSVIWFVNNFGQELLGISQELSFDWSSTLLLIGIACVSIIALVLGVSNKPLQTKPMDILRYE